MGYLGSSIFVGFVVAALISAVLIWIWRALSAPLPTENQATSDRSNDVDLIAQKQIAEPVGDAVDISVSEALAVEPSAELTPAKTQDVEVYAFPEGPVAAPSRPKMPIWKRAAEGRVYDR